MAMTAEAKLREALEAAIWDFEYDDMVGQWPRMLEVMNGNPLWADGKHCGDCTNQPHTCQRCLVEDIQKRADISMKVLSSELEAARRGARLEEAKWWWMYLKPLSEDPDVNEIFRSRIAALASRAAGEGKS
jgi:hypothetical protein